MLSISLIYMVGFPSIWIIVIIFNLRCNILGFSLIWISLKSLIYIAGFLPICIWLSWLALAGGLALAQHHSWPCVRPAEEERQVFGKPQGDDDDQLKRELSILNSDLSVQKTICVRSLLLCYYHSKEIVPGRWHRLCKSSQLQRALRRVIYGWQRISKVKILRIFVLLQMISVSRVLNELISDFDELLDQVKLHQNLHFISWEINAAIYLLITTLIPSRSSAMWRKSKRSERHSWPPPVSTHSLGTLPLWHPSQLKTNKII